MTSDLNASAGTDGLSCSMVTSSSSYYLMWSSKLLDFMQAKVEAEGLHNSSHTMPSEYRHKKIWIDYVNYLSHSENTRKQTDHTQS